MTTCYTNVGSRSLDHIHDTLEKLGFHRKSKVT